MIEIICSCGGTFELMDEEDARNVSCPQCGTLASDLIAQAAQSEPIEEASPAEMEQPQFQVFCVNHPKEYATQNCMNCAKPLCMKCVRDRGYYCSDECRAAVSASEPSMATGKRVSADDNALESIIGVAVKITKLAVLAAVVLGVGYLGYIIYLSKWGPRPHITSSMDVMSGTESFKAVMLDPARTLVQADDELSLINLTATQKLWKVDLRALEEPYSLPKRASSDSEYAFDPSKFRDPLSILDVKGDSVILHSGRQLVVVNAQTGAIAWKFFRPDTSLLQVLPHDDGLLCVFGSSMPTAKTMPPHVASLAFADGHELWSDTNALAYAAAVPIPGNRIITAVLDMPKKTSAADLENREITASGWDVNAFRGAMFGRIQHAMERGSFDLETTADDSPEPEPDSLAKNYTVRFRSLENGTETGARSVSLKHTPQIEQIGRFVCVIAGRDVLAFENGNEPVWQLALPASARLAAADGDVFAVAAGNQVIAFDAKTGQQKWSRDKLKPNRLVVGPDGGVYATVTLSHPDFLQSEAKDFHIEDISIGGTTDPRAPVTFLMKLDQKGATSWGVRNIGGEIVFVKDNAYVFDTTTETRLLSDTGLQVTYHSIHCLSPRSGKEIWTYIKAGEVHEHVILGDQAFLTTTEGNVLGSRENPSYNYHLCMLERK
jgi:outer membrane protein assembly factor BamB